MERASGVCVVGVGVWLKLTQRGHIMTRPNVVESDKLSPTNGSRQKRKIGVEAYWPMHTLNTQRASPTAIIQHDERHAGYKMPFSGPTIMETSLLTEVLIILPHLHQTSKVCFSEFHC